VNSFERISYEISLANLSFTKFLTLILKSTLVSESFQ